MSKSKSGQQGDIEREITTSANSHHEDSNSQDCINNPPSEDPNLPTSSTSTPGAPSTSTGKPLNLVKKSRQKGGHRISGMVTNASVSKFCFQSYSLAERLTQVLALPGKQSHILNPMINFPPKLSKFVQDHFPILAYPGLSLLLVQRI